MENTYGADNVTSTTAPKKPLQRMEPNDKKGIQVITDTNGGKAVNLKFSDPITGELKPANIPYNKRGLPVFDDHAKFTTNIDHSKNYDSQFSQATRDLREAIKSGKVDSKLFNSEQLQDIKSRERTIEGFTWHHNADTGNMQLVPREIHKAVSHDGQKSLSKGR